MKLIRATTTRQSAREREREMGVVKKEREKSEKATEQKHLNFESFFFQLNMLKVVNVSAAAHKNELCYGKN